MNAPQNKRTWLIYAVIDCLPDAYSSGGDGKSDPETPDEAVSDRCLSTL